ncbi:MAG: hypothetical protein RMM98_04135 [Acidobacteriota bacterium]|nr:hypothetical protein [Blastocatellia bacterium]MDW8238780.1 hypothetical protein [Acidobacteriota bacterium]
MQLVAMMLFAFFVSVVFAIISKSTPSERFWYGTKIFFGFMGIGLMVAYLMYPFS